MTGPGHTPAPLPARSIYGFVMCLGTYLLLVIYLAWAFVPIEWLKSVGLTYWPQKYWALAIPVYSMSALLLWVYCILPGASFLVTVPLDSPLSIQDGHSRHDLKQTRRDAIPPMADIHISQVCRHLYLSEAQKRQRCATRENPSRS